MKLDSFFAKHQIFTVNDLIVWLSKKSTCSINQSTLRNSLAYHQKQGHILHIRRGDQETQLFLLRKNLVLKE